MHTQDLTSRQLQVMRFIHQQIETGRPPSIRDIGERFGASHPNGMLCHLKALKRKGYITSGSLEARSIRLTRRAKALLPKKSVTCPHCGEKHEV